MPKPYHIAIKKAGPFIVLVITDLFRYLDYSLNVSMSLGKVHSPEGCLALPVLGAGLEDPSRTLSLSSDNSAHFSTIQQIFYLSEHTSGLKIFLSDNILNSKTAYIMQNKKYIQIVFFMNL